MGLRSPRLYNTAESAVYYEAMPALLGNDHDRVISHMAFRICQVTGVRCVVY